MHILHLSCPVAAVLRGHKAKSHAACTTVSQPEELLRLPPWCAAQVVNFIPDAQSESDTPTLFVFERLDVEEEAEDEEEEHYEASWCFHRHTEGHAAEGLGRVGQGYVHNASQLAKPPDEMGDEYRAGCPAHIQSEQLC